MDATGASKNVNEKSNNTNHEKQTINIVGINNKCLNLQTFMTCMTSSPPWLFTTSSIFETSLLWAINSV